MVAAKDEIESLFVDKAKLKALLQEMRESEPREPQRYKTVQELRQAIIEQGIRPEDNEFTRVYCGAIRMIDVFVYWDTSAMAKRIARVSG